MIAGHRGVEPGHGVLLEHLDLAPILELDLALGDGVGAMLAISILEAAVATLAQMATFEEAKVDRPRPVESTFHWEPTFA